MTLEHFRIEGHVYYVTTAVYGRFPLFSRAAYVIPLVDSLNYYRFKHVVRLLGYCIMPDHLHLLVWPHGRSSVSDFMRDYKKFTAARLIRQAEVEQGAQVLSLFRRAGDETRRSENKVWQDQFWDANVFSEERLREKLDYVHANPVRAGLVATPGEYPYSSWRNYELEDDSLVEVYRGWM